jgi:hypothetical protein
MAVSLGLAKVDIGISTASLRAGLKEAEAMAETSGRKIAGKKTKGLPPSQDFVREPELFVEPPQVRKAFRPPKIPGMVEHLGERAEFTKRATQEQRPARPPLLPRREAGQAPVQEYIANGRPPVLRREVAMPPALEPRARPGRTPPPIPRPGRTPPPAPSSVSGDGIFGKIFDKQTKPLVGQFAKVSGNIGDIKGLGELTSAIGGLGLAAGGVGLAIGAVAYGVNKYTEYIEARNTRSAAIIEGARKYEVSTKGFEAVEAAAGGNEEAIKGMAIAIKELETQGAKASPELRKFGNEIMSLGSVKFTGKVGGGQTSEKDMYAQAGAKRMGEMSYAEQLRVILANKDMRKQAGEQLYNPMQAVAEMLTGNKRWTSTLAKWEKDFQDEKKTVFEKGQLHDESVKLTTAMQTPREKLEADLKHLEKLREAGVDKTTIERAVVSAKSDFIAASPKPGALPTIAEQGSQAAYAKEIEWQQRGEGDSTAEEADKVIAQWIPAIGKALIKREENFRTQTSEAVN